MKKKDKQQKIIFPETLGLKFLAFGRNKIASIMKTLPRSPQDNIMISKLKTFGRIGFQIKHFWDYRKKAPMSITYFRPPFLLSFIETKKETAQFDRPALLRPKIQYIFPRTPAIRSEIVNTVIERTASKEHTPDQIKSPSSVLPGMDSGAPVLSRHKKENLKQEESRIDRGKTLSEGVLNSFSHLLGIRLPSVRVHQDEDSDKYLRSQHADAMTVGHDIFFRAGRYDLKSAPGLGLLGHELTHVAQQQPADWRYPAIVNHRTERYERTAIENEKLVYLKASSQGPQIGQTSNVDPAANFGPATTLPIATASPAPMFANSSRNETEAATSPSMETNSGVLSESEMMRIKEEVYNDLMLRIKVEFERGA